ncbi:uncharacterized protein LOC34619758 [Cyclospora cayetanensis]|uniref:Uncharacterized protein LOC34619758 n=1 Tax=Cyclospora cayetanensis TaxID=88456 RepID=A0A6P6S2E5_9EIME|nr:uncharacterized protein LOC34619758 [Cyclospora cayetanensis]
MQALFEMAGRLASVYSLPSTAIYAASWWTLFTASGLVLLQLALRPPKRAHRSGALAHRREGIKKHRGNTRQRHALSGCSKRGCDAYGNSSSSSSSGGRRLRGSSITTLPDSLLAFTLCLLPLGERLKVCSLVCRRWLDLTRSRLCLWDSTIRVSSASFRQLSTQAARAAVRGLAACGRHAKLVLKVGGPLGAVAGEVAKDLHFLRSLFGHLRGARALSVSVGCPYTAKRLGPSFAAFVQRNKSTLESLEIWEAEFAEATLAALYDSEWPPNEDHAVGIREGLGDSFLAAAAALDASVGPPASRGSGGGGLCGCSRKRAQVSRGMLRRRLEDIRGCCCCLASVEAAIRLYKNFSQVCVVLPRLRCLAVGSWRLLRALHCPRLEELRLATNTAARHQSAAIRQQQRQQQQQMQQQQMQQQVHLPRQQEPPDYWQLTRALREWAHRVTGSGPPPPDSSASGYSKSAVQDLLSFLLRSGSNLVELQTCYTVGALNDALLQAVISAGNALRVESDAAQEAPRILSRILELAVTSASPLSTKQLRSGFLAAALAAAHAALVDAPGWPSSPCFLHAENLESTSLSAPSATFPRISAATDFGPPPCVMQPAAPGDHLVRASAAAAATSMRPCLSGGDIFAAAAGLCAALGGGCRHRRHAAAACGCAVPCALGSEGQLLVVALPRLRVARTSDFLLLSVLLLPRLQELRLPETWGSVANKPISGFSLLWTYLSTYGGGLKALEVKGTAPPLAAFLGAGTTAEPQPFRSGCLEAEATKALQRLLYVHRTHPLMAPLTPDTGRRPAAAAAAAASALPAGMAAGPGAAFRMSEKLSELAAKTVQSIWQHRLALQQNGGSLLQSHDSTEGLRPLYGLKFGQLQHLQCHSSFLPYLVEPLPQCGNLRELRTEGESDGVLWFVALLKALDNLFVRDPCLTLPRRRLGGPQGGPLEAEDEEARGSGNNSTNSTDSNSSGRQKVTLLMKRYTGTAFFFTPNLTCPNLCQLQVQRGDDDFDTFLVNGGAPQLRVLRYQGRLFGGPGAATPRSLMSPFEAETLEGGSASACNLQRGLAMRGLSVNACPVEMSPFASLRELHVWTLDAKALIRLALAAAAASKPSLSRSWQRALERRKEERQAQLQARSHLALQRTQCQRDKEGSRLLLKQKRLYEAYSTRRRRLRRLSAVTAALRERRQRPSEALLEERSLGGASLHESHSRLSREVSSMRQQLQQLQRRLEALATANMRSCVFSSSPSSSSGVNASRETTGQVQRYHRFREGLHRLRRLRSHHQRLVALRRLLQISVADALPQPSIGPLSRTNATQRGTEVETQTRRRDRAQRGRAADFQCSRNCCLWACHRAVAAVSQLLPQLRTCVVQQLKGNATSLRLLLRGLPRLEVFAIEETPKSRRRQRLLQLASNIGFIVRRGPLVIPALRSNLLTWGSATLSRQFRILRRSPAGCKAATAAVTAAEAVVRELMRRAGREGPMQETRTLRTASTKRQRETRHKRRIDSAFSAMGSGLPCKRRRRTPREARAAAVERMRQDSLLARGLAEELEVQLTS